MAPADGVYHKPQDALGVVQLAEHDYLFCIADGVSGGSQLLGQHSGEISRDLVASVAEFVPEKVGNSSNLDLVTRLDTKRKELVAKYENCGWIRPDEGIANDTTLQMYRAKKLVGGEWELSAIRVGKEGDLGPQAYKLPTGESCKFEGSQTGTGRWTSEGAVKIDKVIIPAGSELVLGTDALKRMFIRSNGEPSSRVLFQSIEQAKKRDTRGKTYVSTKFFSLEFSSALDKTRDDASLIHVKLY